MIAAFLRGVVVAGALVAGVYARVLRPRVLRWGATDTEVSGQLPGDEIVPNPRYLATHAVTIRAPAATVWPWLVQMGQGRGGFYSYTWLENLVGCDLHNAARVIPEFQHLQVGDKVRLVPEGNPVPLYFLAAAIHAERALVLHTAGSPAESFRAGLPYATWAFVLEPIDDGTRLIARFRADFKPTAGGWIRNKYLLEPVHFLMERKMLLTIRRLAERLALEQGATAPRRAA